MRGGVGQVPGVPVVILILKLLCITHESERSLITYQQFSVRPTQCVSNVWYTATVCVPNVAVTARGVCGL